MEELAENIEQKPRYKIINPLIIGAALFVLVLSTVVGILLFQDRTKETDKHNTQFSDLPIVRDFDEEPAKKPPSVLYKGEEKIILIKDDYNRNVVRMGDWLIITPEDQDDYSVYARNINTNEIVTILEDAAVRDVLYKHKLASRENNKNSSREGLTSGYEKNLSNFNNDVIFRLNAYLDIGFLFKIYQFKGTFKTVFYADKMNNQPRIVAVDGETFFVLGFGDACTSVINIKKFDYGAFKPIGEFVEFGTSEISTEYIGYNKADDAYVYSEYLIVAAENSCGTPVFRNLKGKTMGGKVIEYLRDDVFPRNITSFVIDTSLKRVYMANDLTLYYYDLASKKLVNVGERNLTSEQRDKKLWLSKVLGEGGLCMNNTLVDHTTGKIISEDSEKCHERYEYSIQAIFESLNLPSEFTLKYL